MSDPAKIAAARHMLDAQKARLERAIAAIEAGGADRWSLEQARRMLSRLESWRRDRDEFVTLALGFMGPNGWGPLLDLICDAAEKLAPVPAEIAPSPAAAGIQSAPIDEAAAVMVVGGDGLEPPTLSV